MMFFIYMLMVLIMLPASAGDSVKYIVEKGDTLSGILYKLNIGPIYGKRGFQKLLAKKNDLPFDGDLIRVGDVLIFPSVRSRDTASEYNSTQTSYGSKNYQHQSFIISPMISRLGLSSSSDDEFQHSDLEIYTKPVPGIHLQYEVQWSERFKVGMFGYLSKVSFFQDDEITFKDLNVSRNQYGFLMGLSSGKSEWQFTAGYYDHLFFTFDTMTLVKTHVVSLPEVQLSYRNRLIESGKMSLKFGTNAKAILPGSSPEIKGKYGYGLGVEFLLGSEKRNLRAFSQYSQANAKDNQTTTMEIGLGYVFEGDFDE